MRKGFATVTLIGIVMLNWAIGYGKGPADLIIILAGRASSYEVTDTQTLQQFSPWSAEYIDWSKGMVHAPPDLSRSSKVFFYQKWPSRRSSDYDCDDLKMIYTVTYVPGHDGQRGYIYLPGRGEEFFYNNIGTIMLGDDDGKWHQASAAWEKVMNQTLRARE
jgi:hypothetical protein